MRMRFWGFGRIAVMLWGGLAAGGLALAQGPSKAPPLARYFPGEDLVAYAEFDGVDNHSEGLKKTAAYRMLTETPTGAMLESILAQVADRVAEPNASQKQLSGKELLGLARHAVRSGFAVGINRKAGEPKPSCVGMVLRGGARGEVRAPIARLIDSMGGGRAKSEAVTKPGDRKVIVVGGQGPNMMFAWWSEGDDLVLSFVAPQGIDAMIEALDGRRPNASANATRRDLGRLEGSFEPVGLAFFDMAALPMLPPQAASLGLDRVKRIDYRWGFDGDAVMTITRLVVPAPRAGMLTLMDQPTFGPADLPRLPDGVNEFTMASFDADRFLGVLQSLVVANDPRAGNQFEAGLGMFKQVTGFRLREDVLSHLGPKMVLYTVPTRGNLPTNPFLGFAQGLVHVPKTTAVIQVRDREAFAPAFEALIAKSNEMIRASMAVPGQPALPEAGFLPIEGPGKGFILNMPVSVLPLSAGMRPAIILGKNALVLGYTPEAARRALALADGAAAPPANPPPAAKTPLPKDMIFLTVNDARESMLPEVIANLPGLINLVGSLSGPGAAPALFGPFMRPGFNRGSAPNRPIVSIAPGLIPDPDAIRPFLSPASYALSVDGQGIRFATRESIPSLNPMTVIPFAIAGSLPATINARSAARRAQSVNNLKQIGLAFHNFESANGNFPADVVGKDGKPLLSWRVAILPFVEQSNLSNQIRMDEPWDSEANKKLWDQMPNLFTVPGSEAEPGMTFYRGFMGKSAFFDPEVPKGLRIASFTDGTSNTIGVVEAREAVNWMKPGTDLPFDRDAKIEAFAASIPGLLGGHFPGGFNALIVDGSVRFLKESVNANVLRALITRDQGEVISGDAF